MKRIVVFFLLIPMCIIVQAQTIQSGYVKTRGRLAADGRSIIPGERLSKVMVKVQHNSPVISGDDGTFTFALPADVNRYLVESVTKKGYVLVDPEVLKRQYAHSTEIPLIFVLEDEAQRQKDIEAATIKVRNTLKREMRKKEDELDALRESNAIKQAKYDSLIKEFYQERNNSESLVKEMAECFVSIDYDQLNDFNRQVQACIENGELMKADSLIRSKGSFEERFIRVKMQQKTNAKREDEIRQEQDYLTKSKALAEKDIQDLAEDLYMQHTIFLQRSLMQDSALYCLKMRADIDSSNPEWQFDVARYAQKQNQFNKARVYYEKALEIGRQLASANPEAYRPAVAATLNNLAGLYSNIQRFTESEQMYKEALEIYRQLASANPEAYRPAVAMILDNLAVLYSNIQRFTESEYMHKEALEIRRQLASANPEAYRPAVAMTLYNLAFLYSNIQRFTESEQMYKEALVIIRQLASANPEAYRPAVAMILNNLAGLYSDIQRFTESEQMYKEALEIRRQLASANPEAYRPAVAMTLYNLAGLYSDIQRFTESEQMYKEALEIGRQLASANPEAYRPAVAATLNNLAGLYSDIQRFTESEQMYKEALEIRRQLVSANPEAYRPDVAATLNNLAGLYSNIQRFTESEQMYKEALEIRRQLASANPEAYRPAVAMTLNDLAVLYSNIQRFTESEQMYKEALEIYRQLASANPEAYRPAVAMTLNDLAGLYFNIQRFTESEQMYKETLEIYRGLAIANPRYIDYVSNVLGVKSFIYMFMREFAKAEQYAREGIEVDSTQTFIYTNLASSLLLQGKYSEAEYIYTIYKDELKDEFLDDFRQFEEVGIIPEEYKADVEKIKRMLNE